MSVKGFFKAVCRALLYFAIYYIWQVIVVNWVSIGAAFSLSSEFEGDISDYAAFVEEMTYRIYEIVNQWSLHITVVAGVLTVLTFIILFKFRKKKPLAEMGITKIQFKSIPFLTVLGFTLNMLVSLVISVIPFPESWVESYIESTASITEAGLIITLITTLICAPIVEEITFRGLIYSRLSSGMPMFAAMLISSWIFGVAHGNIIQMLYAALLGYIICYIRIKYNSLSAAILVHFGFNLFSVVSEAFAGIDDKSYTVMMVAGAVVAIILLGQVIKNNDRKIEYTFGGDNG